MEIKLVFTYVLKTSIYLHCFGIFLPGSNLPADASTKVTAYICNPNYHISISSHLIIKRTVFNLFLQLNGNPNFLKHACGSLYNSCLIIMHNNQIFFLTHIINCARSALVYVFTFPVKIAQIYLLGADTYFVSYGNPFYSFYYIKNFCFPNYRHKIFLLWLSNRK